MTNIMFTLMPREDVISYLNGSWPAKAGATIERVAFLSETAAGGVSVQSGSEPGITWWVVDGVIIPQDAGPLPELEGDELITLPPEEPSTPPVGTYPPDNPPFPPFP
ncbi:hypothetical protein [Streptomyces griseoviridis]|uniref:Uncharacterized protein n=1 Tax=Streptomyces griseoviridis TaxID=45398 RepID=A0ABT9LFD6_STRGD|nr:hypothetical protein [Streptomyces griseoviridis]MDP9682363.1 hypothetical protein [Streptomyces griseoviridis]GGS82011.1 hypothetical protein GCM10010240_14240 [Streptomyces griseoviridis]